MLRAADSLAATALQANVPLVLRWLGAGAGRLPPAAAAAAAGAAASRAWYSNEPIVGGRYQNLTKGTLDDGDGAAPPRAGSTVVLVSGGIESAALLSYWRYWDHAQTLLPLFVDYGQKNARKEEAAQQAICRHLGLDFNAVNASMVAHQLKMSMAGNRYHDPLPHRNLALLSLAASFAADSGAANVAICLTKDDLGAYSSASMPFLRHLEALYETLDPPLALLMPLLGLRRDQVLAMGQQVEAPWHLTYSCGEGGETPCGKCQPCLAREEAFDRADLKDPVMECAVPASA